MVIWPAFRKGQYRANDHPYRAPQFTTCRLVKNFERSLNKSCDGILVLSGIVFVDSCSSKNSFRGTRENNQFFSLQSAFLVYIFCLFQCLNEGCSDFSNVVMFQVVISQMCMLHICLAINIWTFGGIVFRNKNLWFTKLSFILMKSKIETSPKLRLGNS